MLRAGANLINSARSAALAETVTLRHGEVSASLSACVSPRRYQVAQGRGALVYIESWDVLCAAEDYDLGAGPVAPAVGDVIERADGTVYRVTPIDSEAPYRRSDAFGVSLRIHTRRAGA